MERKRKLLRRRAWRCPCPAAIFMNSPLVPKNSLGSEFFEVAVPRKPYYNPANLEKAGSRVKRKEFLQAISKPNSSSPPAYQRSGAARGRLFFRASRLGSSRSRFAPSYGKSLPPLCRDRCSPAAARGFSTAGTRIESRSHCPRVETPGRRLGARGERSASRSALSPSAHAPRAVARTGCARHQGFCRLSQLSRTRPDALFHLHATPHRSFLWHEYPLAV